MSLAGVKIGFVLTGSFCTFAEVVPQMAALKAAGAEIWPVLSPIVQSTDTRFGTASDWRNKIEQIAGRSSITNIVEAEPVGPKKLLDLVVVAPCTGNSLAKMANGITDTNVLMVVKSHLRNERPVVVGVSTNDGLANNADNIGKLLKRRHVYFIPSGKMTLKAKPDPWLRIGPSYSQPLKRHWREGKFNLSYCEGSLSLHKNNDGAGG